MLNQTIKGVCAKNFEATLLFEDFFQVLDCIHRGEDEINAFSIWFLQEIFTAIMMLYKDRKAMVCLPDGDINFFDIASGVL